MPQAVIFLSNVVIPRLIIKDPPIEDPTLLKISFRIGQKKFDITSSRINVPDFLNKGVVEMKGDTAGMRTLLSSELSLQIRYKGRVVGESFIRFAQEFIDKVDTKMRDTIQSEVVPVSFLGDDIGEMELMFFLTVKCGEPEADADPEYVAMCAIISISCQGFPFAVSIRKLATTWVPL